jgi:hypothetical protein
MTPSLMRNKYLSVITFQIMRFRAWHVTSHDIQFVGLSGIQKLKLILDSRFHETL